MPTPYPREFRDDVVAVARQRQVPLKQVAKGFGISDTCLANWMRDADVEDGKRPGVTSDESAELRELRKRNRLLEQENEVLRKAAAYLAQGRRDWDDAHLINAALDIHADDPGDGYRFIADELAQRGFIASENRVWRLCSMQQIFSLHAKKKGRTRQAGPPVHDDLVRRDFTAAAPNVKWLTDITEHPADQGKLYLCAIKDCYSNKIVGYSIGSRMTSSLAVAALRNAITLRAPAAVIVHSDRGSQFRSQSYRRLLRNNRFTGSMGRRRMRRQRRHGIVLLVAAKNVLDTRRWKTREDLRLAIVTWIETKYHRKRRQRGLGKLTLVEFETICTAATAA
ncbi:Transposase InsO and inactivated derivatives [Amycolatopsis xylanica]|uniref:Transposase InsO and inactivated derivatives n=1 Tax=Amycolatopsis xylanica TaxID=589385 RepID=A0A1H3DBL6_9PSEU|nr:Transposase InsO and inactivated derivatives [Amycolatopsis xylanica]